METSGRSFYETNDEVCRGEANPFRSTDNWDRWEALLRVANANGWTLSLAAGYDDAWVESLDIWQQATADEKNVLKTLARAVDEQGVAVQPKGADADAADRRRKKVVAKLRKTWRQLGEKAAGIRKRQKDRRTMDPVKLTLCEEIHRRVTAGEGIKAVCRELYRKNPTMAKDSESLRGSYNTLRKMNRFKAK